ncbi:MAG TPA: phage major capsid protein [Gammaproteobacteria bacterium]|nr:phage major capsid protein [Gammaproteobacteria bacterium]
MSKEILDAIQKKGEAFDEFTKANDARIKALEEKNLARVTELEEKTAKINTALEDAIKAERKAKVELDVQRERIEELEARAKTPGKTIEQKLHGEYLQTFERFVRTGGQDNELGVKLKSIERQLHEQKDVTIGTASAGGYAVPEQIAREVEIQEKLFSPIRDDVKVVQIGTSDYKELVNLRGTTGGWVGETGTRSATATSTLREVVPTQGELYAYPQASEWSLDDIFFNVQNWLAAEIAETFAVEEATAVISGNGTTKPTGMLNTTPANVDDFASPLRSAVTYQFIPSLASPDAILPDTLIDLVYKLNSRYRAGAKFIFNSAVAATIRKLKDTTNQYLWQPGMQMGEPDRLLGYPTSIWEQMSNVSANAFPVGFGNLKRGYVLVDRVGLRITRDEVTTPGYVKFYVRRREGGVVLNNNAIKFLRTT